MLDLVVSTILYAQGEAEQSCRGSLHPREVLSAWKSSSEDDKFLY